MALENGGGGVKPTYLKGHGHEVIEPALHHDDFQAAVQRAQAAFNHPAIVAAEK